MWSGVTLSIIFVYRCGRHSQFVSVALQSVTMDDGHGILSSCCISFLASPMMFTSCNRASRKCAQTVLTGVRVATHYASVPCKLTIIIFAFIRQVAPIPAWWLFKTSATSWPFDLEIGVRVTCDVGYLCAANCSLPRPLFSG